MAGLVASSSRTTTASAVSSARPEPALPIAMPACAAARAGASLTPSPTTSLGALGFPRFYGGHLVLREGASADVGDPDLGGKMAGGTFVVVRQQDRRAAGDSGERDHRRLGVGAEPVGDTGYAARRPVAQEEDAGGRDRSGSS